MTFTEAITTHLNEGKKIRCVNWREGVYLDIWKGYIMQNDAKNCWHWTPKLTDFQEEWEIME